MVLENQTVGKVKGITIIELGKGDTKVAYVHCKEDGYTGVQFVNDKIEKIGTTSGVCGITTDELQPNAMITFTSIESIEVVERALNKAKVFLRNM
tara:strand:- start:1712 stop:1996 length:285 start_codon:yes stop_codon:yes gene_type:complete